MYICFHRMQLIISTAIAHDIPRIAHSTKSTSITEVVVAEFSANLPQVGMHTGPLSSSWQ